MRICFDEMCRDVLQCSNYIEWEHKEEIWDGTRHCESAITCVSCIKVGQSYNIDEYPDSCPHKKTLVKYVSRRRAEHRLFLLKCEKEKMWDILNEVNYDQEII